MKTLNTNYIVIEYDQDKEKEAKRLKEILDKNEMFFSEFLNPYPIIRISNSNEPLTDKETLEVKSIDELKELLVILIPYYINKLNVKGDDESLSTFLKILLANKYKAFENYNIKITEDELPFYLESIYSLIAIDYYETPEEVVDSLFNMNKDEKKKLFDYLNSKYRNNLLNELLQDQVKYLTDASEYKQQDNFVIDNIDELLNYTTQEMLTIDLNNQQVIKMPSLTEKELDSLIIEFLIHIDPSLKWLKEYENMKKNNQIKPGEDWNCTNEDKWVINTKLTHTIEDFRCFIHEFIHYITVKNQKEEKLPIPVKEFPSIYFETLAINYLSKKGYSKEIIDYMLNERNEWTEENVYNLYLMLGLLSSYLTNQEVTVENEVERRLQISDELKTKIPQELSFFYDISEQGINYSFDIANGYFILYPDSIYEEYPYITGTYLADRAVEITSKDPMFIYDMLEITDNLETTNPKDIIDLINQKHKKLIKKHETI